MQFFLNHWYAWLWSAVTLLISIGLGFVAHYALFFILGRIAKRTGTIIDEAFIRHAKKPSKWVFPLLAILVAMPLMPLPASVMGPFRHVVGLGLIAAVAWAVTLVSEVFSDFLSAKYRIDVRDNLTARKIQTQLAVLHRIVVVVVSIVTLSIMLMTFPQIRQLGTSLLASAGLVGLVVGMAMRPTISSLIAGIQIAMTQPIRLEDVVIVEGEWGWIEDITTTYVVVRIWDRRRLVVPLSYFIEHPFQNWTRSTSDLLGTVFVYMDYTVPVEEVRQELQRILKSTDKWKGQVCGLQVTDSREHTVELRALMDARDSGTLWDLRCYVREKLIQFLQQRFPQSLPRERAELHGIPATAEKLAPTLPGAAVSK
jgi:small-conductance mechanosensitive channel